jgi:hypothetical protein
LNGQVGIETSIIEFTSDLIIEILLCIHSWKAVISPLIRRKTTDKLFFMVSQAPIDVNELPVDITNNSLSRTRIEKESAATDERFYVGVNMAWHSSPQFR